MSRDFADEITSVQHARATWLLPCSREELFKIFDKLFDHSCVIQPLICNKTLLDPSLCARELHNEQKLCAIDTSYPGIFHVMPLTKGVDICINDLHTCFDAWDMSFRDVCAISVSKQVAGKVFDKLESLFLDFMPCYKDLLSFIPERAWDIYAKYAQYNADVAQECASYAQCHSCVKEISYYGLTDDRNFKLASNLFVHGFGNTFSLYLERTLAHSIKELNPPDILFSIENEETNNNNNVWLHCTCKGTEAQKFVNIFEDATESYLQIV